MICEVIVSSAAGTLAITVAFTSYLMTRLDQTAKRGIFKYQ